MGKVVKLEAFRGLECALVSAIPELEDNVCVGQAPPNHPEGDVSLAIIPVRSRFLMEQASVHRGVNDQSVVVNVGRHEGLVQLRLSTTTPGKRWELEAAILAVFEGQPLRPGILVTPVLRADCFGDFIAAWELEDDEWNDSRAHDGRWESVIGVTSQIPALAIRGGSPTIRSLQLGLYLGIPGHTPTPTFSTDPEISVVQVNQDGTITPA